MKIKEWCIQSKVSKNDDIKVIQKMLVIIIVIMIVIIIIIVVIIIIIIIIILIISIKIEATIIISVTTKIKTARVKNKFVHLTYLIITFLFAHSFFITT